MSSKMTEDSWKYPYLDDNKKDYGTANNHNCNILFTEKKME